MKASKLSRSGRESVKNFHKRLMGFYGCQGCKEFGNNGCGCWEVGGYRFDSDDTEVEDIGVVNCAKAKIWYSENFQVGESDDVAAPATAIDIYRSILSVTKEVVGDELTEGIWIKAIEEAGYAMWRSIMGPKHKPDSTPEPGIPRI